MKTELIKKAYDVAKERYAEIGVDTEAVLKQLQDFHLSLHCWQADDVKGFEVQAGSMSGGIQSTGNHPGAARNIDEVRQDVLKANRFLTNCRRSRFFGRRQGESHLCIGLRTFFCEPHHAHHRQRLRQQSRTTHQCHCNAIGQIQSCVHTNESTKRQLRHRQRDSCQRCGTGIRACNAIRHTRIRGRRFAIRTERTKADTANRSSTAAYQPARRFVCTMRLKNKIR